MNKALSRNPHLMENASDEELMSLVREQDEAAFEMLLKRHEDKVFGLAVRTLANVEEARDVTQEVFIDLWNNPHAWRSKAKFTTWLYRVTFNRALNARRAMKLKSIFSLSSSDSSEAFSLTDESKPDDDILKSEESLHFEQAFSQLPPKQRAAIHLRYREGLSVGDVSMSLGVSYRSAESLIFRAKQKLKTVLV